MRRGFLKLNNANLRILARYRPRDSALPLSIVSIVLCLLLVTSVLIPLVVSRFYNLGCDFKLTLVDRRYRCRSASSYIF